MKAKATNTRGKHFSTVAMTDNDYDTYWATTDGTNTATVTYQFRQPQRMNRMMLQEYIPLGQRVKSFVVEYQDGKQWLPVSLNEKPPPLVTSACFASRVSPRRASVCASQILAARCASTISAFMMQEKMPTRYCRQRRRLPPPCPIPSSIRKPTRPRRRPTATNAPTASSTAMNSSSTSARSALFHRSITSPTSRNSQRASSATMS